MPDLNKPVKVPDLLIEEVASYHRALVKARKEIETLTGAMKAQQDTIADLTMQITNKLVQANVIEQGQQASLDSRYAEELGVAYVWVHDPNRNVNGATVH